jgi:hypothetical protein
VQLVHETKPSATVLWNFPNISNLGNRSPGDAVYTFGRTNASTSHRLDEDDEDDSDDSNRGMDAGRLQFSVTGGTLSDIDTALEETRLVH